MVRVVPPTTISGWVNNSFVIFAVNCIVLIAVKALGIPEDDIQRDVTVIMPPLDLFSKTK